MATPLLVNFVGDKTGSWRVERCTTVTGPALAAVSHVDVVEGMESTAPSAGWVLRGTTSNERYVERPERNDLVERQPGLGRAHSTCAVLIPITKSGEWWDLTQDERRRIFEHSSHHIAVGLDYLPAIARRLHHSRDLGEAFDFLTWFEFAPADAAAFDDLTGRLRATEEWQYVEREVEIRLVRE